MNDNQHPETHSIIEMLADNELLTVLHSSDIAPEFIEVAATLIRAIKDLWFIELQDLNDGRIIAYRGERPPGEKVAL